MSLLFEYPVFEPDQVLTEKNLNDIVEYLEEQDRDTRSRLIGIGVACGLEVDTDAATQITISKGVGVTSLGYLMTLEKSECTYFREYTDKATKPYQPFKASPTTQIPLWELMTNAEAVEAIDAGDTTVEILAGTGEFTLNEMAVLLYLEIVDVQLENCIGEDCLEKGISREHTVRKLLISKTDMLKIISTGKNKNYNTVGDLLSDLNKKDNLPAISLERLNYNVLDLTKLDLGQINNWTKLKNSYTQVMVKAIPRIANALYKTYGAYESELKDIYNGANPFTNYNLPLITNPLFLQVDGVVQNEALSIQYGYDYLRDLIQAYNEFVEVAGEYKSECCPSPTLFPLHLGLGAVVPLAKRLQPYRNKFMPSPILSGHRDHYEKLRTLHKRLVKLTQDFDPQLYANISDIKITPSLFEAQPLSKRSIGYYYDFSKVLTLNTLWNAEYVQRGWSDRVLSYHSNTYSGIPHVNHPLAFDITDHDFFRIEGHIGQEYKSVLSTIQSQIVDFNLPIDVLGVKLSSDHLDVEIDYNCVDDIQALYKANRDELLACLKAIKAFIQVILLILLTMIKILKFALIVLPQNNPFVQLFPNVTTWGQVFLVNQIYLFYLNKLIGDLPEHIRDFDSRNFAIDYFKVRSFTFFNQVLAEYTADQQTEFNQAYMQNMMIASMYGRILDDCYTAKFNSIYESYKERKLKLQLGRLFPGYVTGSPGMEHMAGAPKGGTFILVYDEIPDLDGPDGEEPPEEEEDDPCFEGEEQQLIILEIFQAAEVLTNPNLLLEEWATWNAQAAQGGRGTPERSKDRVAFSLIEWTPPQTYATPGELILDMFGPKETIPDIENKYRVVADFAVPYRCCKDCLKVEELPAPDASVDLSKDEFCKKDTTKYPITVEPAGGTLTGDGTLEENGVYYFQPSSVTGAGEQVTITYTFEGVPATKNVKVYDPKAIFTATLVGQSITVDNQSTGADTWLWTVQEDGRTYTEESPTIDVSNYQYGTATIELIASKSICSSDPATQTVTIPNEPVTIGITPQEFCLGNEPAGSMHEVFVSPAGGTLEPAAVTSEDNGTFYFHPHNANLGQTTLTYTLNGETASVNVFVYNPQAGFTEEENTAENIRLENSSTNYDSVSWEVDGVEEFSTDPVGIDLNPALYSGDIRVIITAKAGQNCSDTHEDTIDVQTPVDVVFDLQYPDSNQPYTYCNSDDAAYKFTTLPAGDSVGGDTMGLSQDSNGDYFFKPIGVPAGNYTFNYMGDVVNVFVIDSPSISLRKSASFNPSVCQVFVNFTILGAAVTTTEWIIKGLPKLTGSGNTMGIPFDIKTQPKYEVRVEARTAEGCILTTIDQLDFSSFQERCGQGSPGGGGDLGGGDLGGGGDIRLPDLGRGGGSGTDVGNGPGLGDMVTVSVTNSAMDIINAYTDELTNWTKASAANKKSFADGKKNTEIAKKYKQAFEDTLKAIRAALRKKDNDAVTQLIKSNNEIFDSMIGQISKVQKAIGVRTNLYLTVQYFIKVQADLNRRRLDVNPENSLKKAITSAKRKLRKQLKVLELVKTMEEYVK